MILWERLPLEDRGRSSLSVAMRQAIADSWAPVSARRPKEGDPPPTGTYAATVVRQ